MTTTRRTRRPTVEALEGRALLTDGIGVDPGRATEPAEVAMVPPVVPVIIWVDRASMPADFDPIAVQARIRAIGAALDVRIDIVPTNSTYAQLAPTGASWNGSGFVATQTGVEPIRTIDYVEVYADFRTGGGTWIGTYANPGQVGVHLETTRGAATPDIMYANILFHETFYHGVMENWHTYVEQTPLGVSEASRSVPLVLTPGEIVRLNTWLGP